MEEAHTVAEAVAIVLAYLWGALPTAYLVARFRYGVDIRRYGSGNVGASNYMRQIGSRTGFAVGLFDGFAKGALPIVVADRVFGVSLWGQVGLSLAAVVGHNWSPYIRFTGGRGVATAMGAYVGFGLWPQLLVGIVVVGLIGWLWMRNLALWMVLGMSLMVPLSLVLDQPMEITAVLLGLVLLVLAKRLTSNGERPAEGVGRLRLVLNRLLYDRDVAERDDWVVRTPEESRRGQPE